MGSNDRLNFAVIGLNGRGYAHLSSLKANKSAARIYACLRCRQDTFSRNLRTRRSRRWVKLPAQSRTSAKILDRKNVDAITIATPDHWHAPMAIAGLQAGKHVYVEKPCSHNPAEGELLVRRSRSTASWCRWGRSSVLRRTPSRLSQKIRDGAIGRPYFGKAWYSNTRKSIGMGKEVPVPPQLDWDLWQGPVPRRPYRDNVHPYNWHWFKIYGTGETLNNGTHEVDVCRWALGVEYPKRVTASGGRYQFHDDWQFYDTLVTSFEYDDQMISWEGKSCQGMKYYGRDRGSTIMGTNGSVLLDRDGYEIYDLNGKKTSEVKTGKETSSSDLLGRDSMTDAHFANFIAAIRKGEKLNAPINVGNVSVTMLQISNIAWEVNRELHLDPKDGRIVDDAEAMRMWKREYQPGWEPHV